MSLVLAGTADSITYVLDAAPATNQLPASVYYALQGGAGNQANTLSAGTTPVTILAGSGTAAIVVNSLVIPNRDTATRTVTVNMVTGAGTFEQVQVILASGSHLNYSSGNGWYVMDKNGNFLETVTVSGGTSTVNQGTANTIANSWPVEITDGTNILGTAAHPVATSITNILLSPSLGTALVGTTTAQSLAGTSSTNITSIQVVSYQPILAAGVVTLTIMGGNGATVFTMLVPVATATALNPFVVLDLIGLNLTVTNSGSPISAKLSANLTSGTIIVNITSM